MSIKSMPLPELGHLRCMLSRAGRDTSVTAITVPDICAGSSFDDHSPIGVAAQDDAVEVLPTNYIQNILNVRVEIDLAGEKVGSFA